MASFPEDFIWGAATSAYQIEGAVREGGRGASIWDRFSHTPGKTKNGDTGDVAADSFHRFREDVELLRQMGLGAYRFSLSWPRIDPQGDLSFNRAGLDYYDALVNALVAAGIEPWITIYHWDLPEALEDSGGWRSEHTARSFAAYAKATEVEPTPVSGGGFAPVRRQNPWQYESIPCGLFLARTQIRSPETASHSTRCNFRAIFRAEEAALLTQGNDDKWKSAEKGPRGAAWVRLPSP